jgi:hypothetical protein
MELNLGFASGAVTGDGRDDVGTFVIKGKYDGPARECHWTKSYLGAHDVFYRGFREGKGIWGTWEIGILVHGGFHIWPLPLGKGEESVEKAGAEPSQPVEARGVLQGRGVLSAWHKFVSIEPRARPFLLPPGSAAKRPALPR